jgi:hypothetical protein
VSDSEGPTPAKFDWAVKVYEAMLKEARPEEFQLFEEDGVQSYMVYTGHLTGLYSALGAPNPYYTSVNAVLVKQGCMHQLRRGGGTAESKWVLIKPPTEEGFREAMQGGSRPKGKTAILEQQVKDLRTTLNGVLDRLSMIEQKMHDDDQLSQV